MAAARPARRPSAAVTRHAGDIGLGGASASRRQAVQEFKRQAILAAAATVFADQGLEGATMRAIAAAAGYTPGALYSYYPSKEAIYGDILAESLGALSQTIKRAATAATDPALRVHAAAGAFYTYYRDNRQALELGLYLAQGLRPSGLSPALDRQLNGRLIAALQTIATAIASHGELDQRQAGLEAVALGCQLCGILLMQATGRLKMLDVSGDALVERAIDDLLARLRRGRPASAKP